MAEEITEDTLPPGVRPRSSSALPPGVRPRSSALPPGVKPRGSSLPPGVRPRGAAAAPSEDAEGPQKSAQGAIDQSIRAGKQGIEMLQAEAKKPFFAGEISVDKFDRDNAVSMDGPSEADIAASAPKPNPVVQALGKVETLNDVREITNKQFATAAALKEAEALSKVTGREVDASRLPPPPSEDPVRPGLLQRVVDYLTRPISTVAGATKAAVEGGSLSDIGSAALRGVTGEEKTFMGDVLESAGVPEGGALEGDVLDLPRAAAGKYQQNHLKVTARDVAGFGLDIAADPLTYVSGGYGRAIPLPSGVRLSKEGASLLRTGIEAATEGGIERGAARRIAEEGVQGAIDDGARGLVDRGGIKFAGKTLPGTGQADQALRGAVRSTAARIRQTDSGRRLFEFGRRVRGLYDRDAAVRDYPDYIPDKQAKLDLERADLLDADDEAAVIFEGTTAADQDTITRALDEGLVDELPEKLRRVARALEEAQIDLRKQEINLGLGDTVRDDYMMHAYENYPSLQGQGMGGGASPNLRSNDARIIPTLREAEAAGLRPVTTNAYELFIMRKMASSRARRSRELLDKAAQKFGLHGTEIAPPTLRAEGGNPVPGLDAEFKERAGRSSAGQDFLDTVETNHDYVTRDGRRFESYRTRDGRGLWAFTTKEGDRTVTYAARRVGDSNVRMRITRDADGVTRIEFGRPRARAGGPLLKYRDAVPPRVHAKDAEFAVDQMDGELWGTHDEIVDLRDSVGPYAGAREGADRERMVDTARELLGDEFLVYKKPGDTSESYFLKPPKGETERFVATPESIQHPGFPLDGELILMPQKLRAVPKDAPAGGMLPRSSVSAEVKARGADLSLENIEGGLARGIEGPDLQAASRELSRIFPGANNLRNGYDDAQKLLGGVRRVPLRDPAQRVTIGLPLPYRIAHELVPLPNSVVTAPAPAAQTQLPLAIQGGARTERTVVDQAAQRIEGRQIFVPRAIAEDIQSLGGSPEITGAIGTFVRGLDFATNFWKGTVTSLFPAFHARNAVSNVQNSFLRIGVDVLNPIRRAEAQALLRGTDDVFVTKLGERYTMRELAREMRDEGLEGTFASRTELQTSRTTGEVIGDNRAFRGGRRVGNAIENEAKATLFLSEVRHGMTPKQAAHITKQFLFDYDNLAPFEREVMRRAFPFMTFTRKNIPLQLSALGTAPGRQAVIAKFFATPGNQAEIERDLRNWPDFVTNGLAKRVGTDSEGRPVLLWNAGAPIEDLNKVLPQTRSSESLGGESARTWLTMLNPFVKFLVEEASGKDLFLDRDLKDVNQIYQVYGKALEKAPEPVQDWLGFHREYTRKGDVRYEMDPQKFHLIRSFFLSRLYSTAGKLFDPTKDPVTQALNTFTGMRIGSVDYETQVYPKLRANADERLKAAREEKKQQERTLLIEGGKRQPQPGGK